MLEPRSTFYVGSHAFFVVSLFDLIISINVTNIEDIRDDNFFLFRMMTNWILSFKILNEISIVAR